MKIDKQCKLYVTEYFWYEDSFLPNEKHIIITKYTFLMH